MVSRLYRRERQPMSEQFRLVLLQKAGNIQGREHTRDKELVSEEKRIRPRSKKFSRPLRGCANSHKSAGGLGWNWRQTGASASLNLFRSKVFDRRKVSKEGI